MSLDWLASARHVYGSEIDDLKRQLHHKRKRQIGRDSQQDDRLALLEQQIKMLQGALLILAEQLKARDALPPEEYARIEALIEASNKLPEPEPLIPTQPPPLPRQPPPPNPELDALTQALDKHKNHPHRY